MWEVWHVFQARNLAGNRELPTICLKGVLQTSGDSDPLYLTKFPGKVHCPTETLSWKEKLKTLLIHLD